ncbi:MAG: ATP-binding protein, partial [Deltaproteobacteria bacterium]|nr:ATP-binding protein [Deltaproteobacteria bacterium]
PMIRDAVEEVRRIQRNLRPAMLDDLGILATISWFCRDFEKIYPDIHIEKQIELEETDVPESLKIVVFRILQEAFNNISKHSRADRVSVSLKRETGRLTLSIHDNGVGFKPGQEAPEEVIEKGLGLTSMQERTELSDGHFSIESKKGEGTTIMAFWAL